MVKVKRTVGGLTGAVLLAMAASAWGAGAGPTLSDCQDAWLDSSASQSCGISQVHNVLATVSVDNDQCKVNVDCSTNTYGLHRNQTFVGSTTEMASLHNCNGYLKVDSC